MLFTSYEFLGFVLVLLVLYYGFPKRYQWIVLLIMSGVFYYMANPLYLLYIGTTCVTIWFTACRMETYSGKAPAGWKLSQEEKKAYKRGQKKKRKRWLVCCIVLNVGILAVTKYLDFVLENIRAVLAASGSAGNIPSLPFSFLVPLGISFYTFQSLGYLIDVYWGKVKAEKNLLKVSLFISFFPQLIQGPISRFGDLSGTLYEEHPLKAENICYGMQRILWGFFKKLVIADRIFPAVALITGDVNAYGGAYAFVGMVFYTLQLYADFSGGIDITIGLAQMLGIVVQENFHRPYFSKSLKEYWRRWHISMANWFKDYIFYPVSSGKAILHVSKFCRKHFGDAVGKRLPVYIASAVVWFTTGVWHGADWNFIVWGMANFAVLMISQELEPLYSRFHKRFPVGNGFCYKLFRVGRTFLLVCCLNMFDCYRTLGETFRAFGSMFVASNWQILWNGELLRLGLSVQDYVVLACATALLLTVSLVQRSGSVRGRIAAKPYPVRAALWFGLFVAVLILGAYGVGYDANQFIYNRF